MTLLDHCGTVRCSDDLPEYTGYFLKDTPQSIGKAFKNEEG
jgi:hypothetical protein